VVEALAEGGIEVTTTCVAKSEAKTEVDQEDIALLKKRPFNEDQVN
jgi:hypothetical protein